MTSAVSAIQSQNLSVNSGAFRHLVWRAMSVRERTRSVKGTQLATPETTAEAYDRWLNVVADGDVELFERRLSWMSEVPDNFDLLFSDTPPEQFAVPVWSGELVRLVAVTRSNSARTEISGFPRELVTERRTDLPFAAIFSGAIYLARQKLAEQCVDHGLSAESVLGRWSPTAWLELETGLLQSLIGICTKALDESFQADLPFGRRALNRLGFESTPTGNTTRFEEFIRRQTGSGLLDLIDNYPVLGRLLAVRISNWCTATREMLQRFDDDQAAIRQMLAVNGSDDELRVVNVKSGLSDPHNAGRTVGVLILSNGKRLVYKPRSLQLDATFQRFLEWLNHVAPEWSFRTMSMLDRSEYGWSEYVSPAPCTSTSEVERFYSRAGGLAAVCYALNATDMHHENLLAAGEYPVLIDLETLLAPRSFIDSLETDELFENPAAESILKTGLFPQWAVNRSDLISFDVGGLTGGSRPASPLTARRWCHINTDDMTMLPRPMFPPESENLPRLNGERQSVWDYLAAFQAGFQDMYGLLVSNRDELMASNGPLQGFISGETRVILRDTQNYASLLDESLRPEYLTSGIDRSMLLETLVRPLLKNDAKRNWGRYADLEIEAIEGLDIPRLTTSCNGDTRGSALDQIPSPSCIEQVRQRIRSLDPQVDQSLQLGLIVELISSRSGKHIPKPHFVSGPASSLTSNESGKLFIEEARSIARVILNHAITDRSGNLFWLGGVAASSNTHEGRLEFGVSDLALYEGRSGTALFFAALFNSTLDEEYREAALASLKPLLQHIQGANSSTGQILNALPAGAALGVGSLIYTLSRSSEFLDSPELAEASVKLASEMSPEWILKDPHLDVMKGVAGLAITLLTSFRSTGETEFLRKATVCGERLLESRTPSANNFLAWKIPTEDVPLTGYSHGAAGFASSLLKLFEATEESAFLDAALETIQFENSCFIQEVGNWADLRKLDGKKSRQTRALTMWCNGSVGIGLARLHGLSHQRTATICRADALKAIENVSREEMATMDHCCCGQFGRTELLVSAASRLQRPDLLEDARTLAGKTLIRAAEDGYRINRGEAIRASVSPAFFTGLSGIGYQLLRLAAPEQFPSVLTFE